MKTRGLIITILIAFFLQPFISALLPNWMVLDLNFCLLVILGLTMDSEDMAIPIAVIGGVALFKDSFNSQFVGVSAISMIIVLALILYIRRTANNENPVSVGLIVLGANIIHTLCYWGFLYLLRSPYGFMYMITRMPMMVIPNTIVTFVVVFILSRRSVVRVR